MEEDYLGGFVLGTVATFMAVILFFAMPVKQKVYINSKLEVSVDTITADKSRWYYKSDSTNKNIFISVYREKTGKPYEQTTLEPDDYVDFDLIQGVNIIHIKTLGQYPFIDKRIKVIKINER
jgi:hypothetical protein